MYNREHQEFSDLEELGESHNKMDKWMQLENQAKVIVNESDSDSSST